MGVFILGNLLCALAPSYSLLMAARIVCALCHGAFFGLGTVVAAALVPQEKRTQAIAMMFGGLALANVLGVPFGTALGNAFGWRQTFWAVVAIGFVASFALYAWLPRDVPTPPIRLIQEARSLGSAQVLLAMVISVLASASLFGVLTYITPILENVTRLSASSVTLMLLLFGVGLTLGNLLGGRLGDWRLMPSLIGILVLLAPLLALFTLTSKAVIPAAATIFCWGLLAFALISPLQMRVVNEAAGAPSLASTLNQGAFNLGNATGAWIGDVGLTHGLPYDQLPWIGAALAAVALLFTIISYRRAQAKIPADHQPDA
jgi:DHA1 family inner membrane transport protein